LKTAIWWVLSETVGVFDTEGDGVCVQDKPGDEHGVRWLHRCFGENFYDLDENVA
jgi:hypothetical protein